MGVRTRWTTIGTTAVVVAAGTLAVAAPAAGAPAQSSRVLPFLNQPASAVDAAGGSLVVGEVLDNRAIRAYFRNPTGTWSASVPVVAQADYGGAVVDIAVTGGPSGAFVITWVTQVVSTGGTAENTVHSATRSATGTVSKPVSLFTQTVDDAAADRLLIASNDRGDAAVALAQPEKVARYVRGTEWQSYPVPGGDTERQADLMLSSARTVDLTYVSGSGTDTQLQQRTLTAAAAGFADAPDRTIPVDHASSDLRFDIAMDSAGLQTLIVDPTAQLQTAVYREATRRGTFVKAFEDDTLGADPHGAPHVASRGTFTRVTYAVDDEGAGQATRLYNGTTWGPERTSAGFGSDQRLSRPLAIGTDGRGVQIAFGGTYTEDGTQASDGHVQRSLLETGSRTDQDVTVNGSTGREPALDVGPTGVSQVVITERIVVDFRVVDRTVVLVRR